MNKKLIHLFAEQAAIDPALSEQVAKLQTPADLVTLAAGHDVTLTIEEAEAALPHIHTLFTADGKLSDGALDAISGGACATCTATQCDDPC